MAHLLAMRKEVGRWTPARSVVGRLGLATPGQERRDRLGRRLHAGGHTCREGLGGGVLHINHLLSGCRCLVRLTRHLAMLAVAGSPISSVYPSHWPFGFASKK